MPYYPQPMSATPLQIALAATPTTVHEVPANAEDTVQTLTIQNTDASNAITYVVYNVPPAGTAGPTNIVDAGTLPPKGIAGSSKVVPMMVAKVLPATSKIQVECGTVTDLNVDGSVVRRNG